MPSAKILAEKQERIAKLAEEMKGAESFVFVASRGLTVAQDTAMRKELRDNGVKYEVIKNTTLKRVFETLGVEGVSDLFAGPTAVAYADNVTTPAKILAKYEKEYEPLEIKGGVIAGKAASIDEIKTLAAIPDVETLYSQVVYGLLFPFTKLAMLVKAVAEKKEEEEGAPAAAPVAEEAPAAEAPAEEAPAAAEAEPVAVAAEAPAEEAAPAEPEA